MVRLRHGNGVKRSREEVRAAAPLRGDLMVHVYRGVLSAYLHPSETRSDPLVLENPRLTRMNSTSFIVVGHEVEFYRGTVRRCEQAWWCQLPAKPPAMELTAPALNREEKRLARLERG